MDNERRYSKKELKKLPTGTILANYGTLYFKTYTVWISDGGSFYTAGELDGWMFSPVFAPEPESD